LLISLLEELVKSLFRRHFLSDEPSLWDLHFIMPKIHRTLHPNQHFFFSIILLGYLISKISESPPGSIVSCTQLPLGLWAPMAMTVGSRNFTTLQLLSEVSKLLT